MAGLSMLWSARSIAVVGASGRAGSLGRLPVEYLLRFGFAGRILPINPTATEICGLPAYPNLAAAGPVDLALIMVGADKAVAAVAECAAHGVPVAIVGASGFAEAGDAELQEALLAARGDTRILGPNCIGAAALGTGLVASFSPWFGGEATTLGSAAGAPGVRGPGSEPGVPGVRGPGSEPGVPGGAGPALALLPTGDPGPRGGSTLQGTHTDTRGGARRTPAAGIALVSQSGALGFGAASLAVERGLPLGWVVTTGNEADVTALEVLTELAAEPDCAGLLGYVESLHDGPALRRLAATGKPVALLVAGRSAAGRRAAASHTGALAGDDRVVDAALRQLGITRVADVDDLLDAGEAFAATAGRTTGGTVHPGRARVADYAEPRRSGPPRIAVVTTSGGSGILAADAIESAGLTLADLTPGTRAALDEIVPAFGSTENPIDVTATVMRDRTLVERCLRAVDRDPGVDAVALCFCVLTGDDVTGIVEALTHVTKPVVVARTGAEHLAPTATAMLRRLGVASFPTPARAIRALAATLTTAEPEPADPGTGTPAPAEHGAGTPALTGSEATANQSPDASAPLTDEWQLKAALAEAGVPVPRGHFLDSPADFDFERAVLKAVAPGLVHKTEAGGVILNVTQESVAEAYRKIAKIGRVWAEEQVDGGVEILVGIAPSPLGRVLTIGAGGTLAELLDDVAIRLLPADPASLLAELKIRKLLDGYRGKPPLDTPALLDVVRRLVRLTAHWPGDVAVELNPVLVREHGAVVLDAVAVREV
ncbi:acetate--CoA ligase family protein [Longispora sp. NPDC051575]|uniref:acetate--CoA ligase family protein n=1 Tax=Longispora sp. NPDC051575 TaxID=3154943 RepID=UPI00344058AE